MKPLQQKCKAYNLPQFFMQQGLYAYYHPIETGQNTEVVINKKKVLMFGSNSYLGLTNHPDIIDAGISALNKYGTGASGSRLMNGNLDLHVNLETKLADFVDKESATVFSTGFQTNQGVISCLLGRNDYVVIDDKCHASIIDGCRLTHAKTLKFKHNDMDSLEKILQKTDPSKITLIVVDGVFSMEGDIAKLDQICDLSDKYNASILVDDAHALGVIGKNGSGTASHFGVTDRVDLIMGTFSKSLASLGGFIAGDEAMINYIKHNARALLFSASIPPASAATVNKAIDIISLEPERIEKLWENTKYAMKRLDEEGFDTGNTETPIIPIAVGEDINAFKYSAMLLDEGVYVNPVVHPAVAKDEAILRFSLMATHTFEQIDSAINSLVLCREQLKSNILSL